MQPPDYMSQQHEADKQPQARELFLKIAEYRKDPMEQRQVFEALWNFWNFAHAFDDLVDESSWPVEKKQLAWKAMRDFASALLINPVVFNNAVGIEALFTSAINRQILADVLEKKGEPAELLRAVRCADLDIIVHFARLAGGKPAMDEVNVLMEYDEAEPQPQSAPASGTPAAHQERTE